jgi:hypothetical protein
MSSPVALFGTTRSLFAGLSCRCEGRKRRSVLEVLGAVVGQFQVELAEQDLLCCRPLQQRAKCHSAVRSQEVDGGALPTRSTRLSWSCVKAIPSPGSRPVGFTCLGS